MSRLLLTLLLCSFLYGTSVCLLCVLSHYKRTRVVRVFDTRSLRLGLMAICTLMCASAWRFWYVVVGRHETTLGVGLGTFVLIGAPIAWVYYMRKQSEVRGTWLIAKQK